jgi:hypothetical protein
MYRCIDNIMYTYSPNSSKYLNCIHPRVSLKPRNSKMSSSLNSLFSKLSSVSSNIAKVKKVVQDVQVRPQRVSGHTFSRYSDTMSFREREREREYFRFV